MYSESGNDLTLVERKKESFAWFDLGVGLAKNYLWVWQFRPITGLIRQYLEWMRQSVLVDSFDASRPGLRQVHKVGSAVILYTQCCVKAWREFMVLPMRELPLQSYFVKLRLWTRPPGIPQRARFIQGYPDLRDPGNLAVDNETILDIEKPCHRGSPFVSWNISHMACKACCMVCGTMQ